ncbi:hypothetical protein BZG36_03612 [Bifiguratus adelaidae]|uniref:Uncharacterized protein n=1 Tax=Bifiguratus adelaidae TaxID=1938954 RepID=A0A261Y001_9FUNG|nr:hypothetical protein BZG36_03612 [Bifiguratus adelaidae]
MESPVAPDRSSALKRVSSAVLGNLTWQAEGLLLLVIVAYVAFWYVGKTRNQKLAKEWMSFALPYLREQWSLVGDGKGNALIRDGPADYIFYSSGRRNAQYAHGYIHLQPRNDLSKWLASAVLSRLGYAKASRDVIDINVALDNALFDNVVFGIIDRRESKGLREQRFDLKKFTRSDTAPKNLSNEYLVSSDSNELTQTILKDGLDARFNAVDKYLGAVVVSTYPQRAPEKFEGPFPLTLTAQIKLPANVNDVQETLPALQLICDLIDILPQKLANLRGDIKTKLAKTRDNVAKEYAKIAAEERHEEILQRKLEKKKEEEAKSLNANHDCLHIGYTGSLVNGSTGDDMDLEDVPAQDIKQLEQFLRDKAKCVPVFMEASLSRGHYEGYCKQVLWPLLHYMMWNDSTGGQKEKEEWEAYVKVNERFADVVLNEYRDGDLVFIHDYHLFLLPALLREYVPDIKIGVFLHSPFPSSEIFRCLPRRIPVLEGLLGANMIGFQTHPYARHFISTCTRVLGLESTSTGIDALSHHVHIGTYPIGIDVEKVEQYRLEDGVMKKLRRMKETYAGKKIIVGRDKLDLVKGVLQKLASYEKFLEMYPEWREEVVLIQVTSPPLSPHPKLESKVIDLVSHINSTYGSLEFSPLQYFSQNIDRDEYYALLSIADVCLISSVRDGMNTTSLEYVLCQQENKGTLILSEFTGTAGNLSAATLINPWDHSGVARSINDALTMSDDERRSRHAALLNYVRTHDVNFWAESFLVDFIAHLEDTQERTGPLRKLDIGDVKEKWKKASRKLVLFGYDAMLPNVRRKAATPMTPLAPPRLLPALHHLAYDKSNTIWVISGHTQTALMDQLGHIPNLGLAAEHGCFIKAPDDNTWIDLVDEIDMKWYHEVETVFEYYAERTSGSFIDHKKRSLIWNYRGADPAYGAFEAKECQNHLEDALLGKYPLEIIVGKRQLEVRPIAVNKGMVAKKLLDSSIRESAQEGDRRRGSEDKFPSPLTPHTPNVRRQSSASSTTGMVAGSKMMDTEALNDTSSRAYDLTLCIGDDRSDEGMYRALHKSGLPHSMWYAIKVGSIEGKTSATYTIPSGEDVVRLVEALADSEWTSQT